MEFDVVAVSACFVDLVCYTSRLPGPGETIHGKKFVIGHGGKGSNHSVAASKLGARSALVARLGDDWFGDEFLKGLKNCSVDTTYVKQLKNETSGLAQITVGESGENQIVIVSGANEKITVKDVLEVKQVIETSYVLTCTMEIPLECTIEALKIKSASNKGISILNFAPAPSETEINTSLYSLPDIFCVNKTEASICTGETIHNINDAYKAATDLRNKGCKNVIITLGGEGCVVVTNDNVTTHVTAPKVTPVDTTGAGDAFIGALAFFAAKFKHLSLVEIISRACKIASVSVQIEGSQISLPRRDQVPQDLFQP